MVCCDILLDHLIKYMYHEQWSHSACVLHVKVYVCYSNQHDQFWICYPPSPSFDLALCCFSRVVLFVDEADAFLRKRSQVHVHVDAVLMS